MKVDLSLVLSIAALTVAVFSVIGFWINSIKSKTTYDAMGRIRLDPVREAAEADIGKIYSEMYRDRGRWDQINHLNLDMANNVKFRSGDDQENFAVDSDKFLRNFGISSETATIIRDQVFVVSPLSSEEDEPYSVVKYACEAAGLRTIRGDEKNISGAILPVIISEIVKSRFIIANLNGRNPNVFYEMGISQALGKDVLMFAKRENLRDLPFDITHQRIIFYDTVDQLYERITLAIAQLGWEIERSIRKS
jgi:hypothetical protein